MYGENWETVPFSDLIGKVLESVHIDGDMVTFKTVFGEEYKMYHNRDCCERVEVDDWVGDTKDLLGYLITKAEEVVHENENPPGVDIPDYQDSFTWTFYHLATVNGYVTIRWYGESNGYYSERVDFAKKIT